METQVSYISFIIDSNNKESTLPACELQGIIKEAVTAKIWESEQNLAQGTKISKVTLNSQTNL